MILPCRTLWVVFLRASFTWGDFFFLRSAVNFPHSSLTYVFFHFCPFYIMGSCCTFYRFPSLPVFEFWPPTSSPGISNLIPVSSLSSRPAPGSSSLLVVLFFWFSQPYLSSAYDLNPPLRLSLLLILRASPLPIRCPPGPPNILLLLEDLCLPPCHFGILIALLVSSSFFRILSSPYVFLFAIRCPPLVVPASSSLS